ncbi:MAG: hypothetical protein Q9183_001081 [Haloplaca sp. 2 TL-2023]
MPDRGVLNDGKRQGQDTGAGMTPASEGPTSEDQGYDRGITAWTQVAVSHLLVINGFGYFSSFAFFQAHWETSLSRSSSDIAWVGSLQLCLLFFVGAFSGRAMDAGYFRWLLTAGCSLQILGVFATSSVTQFWQLMLAQGVAQGLGNGLLFTPLVTLVSTYFEKKRAIALGLAACGAPVGGLIFSTIARQLGPALPFEWLVRVMGFVLLFNAFLIAALARPRPIKRTSGPLVEWQAFRELPYTLYAIGVFFTLWGLYTAYFYTATFGKDIIGVSSSTSLVLLLVLNGAGIPGRIVPALIADAFFGSFNTLIPCVFCVSITLYCWMVVVNVEGYIAFVVFYGIFANAVQTLFPSTLSHLTTDITKMGVRTGMVFTIGSFACLTGPPIAGMLISVADGSYRFAQLFGATSVLLGAMFVLASRLTQTLPSHIWKLGDSRVC